MGQTSDDYWNKSQLRKRGWSDKAIEEILGRPDRFEENPKYRNAPPMGLFLKTRVNRAELSREYKGWVERNSNRRSGSRKAVQMKERKLLEEVERWVINLERTDLDSLLDRSREHLNEAHPGGDHIKEILLREANGGYLMVWFLRHQLLCSDETTSRLYRRVGKRKAYIRLNQRVCSEIARVYPSLLEEALRQSREKIECGRRGQDVQ